MQMRIGFVLGALAAQCTVMTCFSHEILAQSSESPAARCLWEGWLPPSAGRERVRRTEHLDAASAARLRAAARDGDKNTRLLAVNRLGAAQDDESIRTLVQLTSDPDEMVKEAAARALGRAGALSQVRSVERLAASPNEHLRQGAVWALGQLQVQSTVPTLIVASRDSNKHVRTDATWALGLTGGVEAAARLKELAFDPSPHVRLAVACSLGKLDVRDPRTRQILSALSRDSVIVVRDAARWAAARLAADPLIPPM